MNDEKNYNKLLEILGTILFMTLYALIGLYVFPIIFIFFPVIIIFFGYKRGILQSIFIFLIVSFEVGFLTEAYIGILLVLLFLPISLTIIYGLKYRRKPVEILLSSAVVFFISILLIFVYTQNAFGINIINKMEESFKDILNVQIDMFEEMGLTNYEILKTKDLLENGYKYFIWILPSVLIIFSMFLSFCNYYISVHILRKSGIGIVTIPRFSKFKLPNNFMAGIIIMLISAYILKRVDLPHYDTLFLNIAVFIYIMFVIQGLSVVDFYLVKAKMNLILRIILLGVINVAAPLSTIISIIGITDTIFDFRRLRKQKS